MRSPKTILFICVLTANFSTACEVVAEGRFTVGLGALKTNGLYEGGESGLGPLPYLSYDAGNWHIGFDGARYQFLDGDAVELAIGVTPRAAPDFPNTGLFIGLDRNRTLEGLLSVEYAIADNSRVSLSWQRDLLSEHGGYEISVSVARTAETQFMWLDLQAGLRHRSADFNEYLVGVTPGEATRTRAAYAPGATTTPFASVTSFLPLGERSTLFGTASFDFFGEAYRDSPLVDRSTSISLGLGIAYSF